ncbi:MAG: hypothetical protein L3J19_02900 [Sulfurimonas sp.]|nr:hypothetical protein [Sulfurimonas sp.]
MNKKIEKVLKIWHKHFSDENHQYSEFESSDIEYFVGCLLYNNFVFSKALDTMKTIDLSYDFITECGDEYDEVSDILKSIKFESEEEKLEFLHNFIRESKSKYSADELYLLNRLEYHINAIAERSSLNKKADNVEFIAPNRSANPLLR